MSFNRDAAASQRARTATAQLQERGIALPKAVADALEVLALTEANKPPAPDRHAIRDLILAGADVAELHAAALAELAGPLIATAHGQAVQHAAYSVLEAITDSHKAIHRELAKKADQHIARLAKAAEIDVPLDALIRAGRTADAEAVATAAVDERELDALFRWRDRYLWPNRRPEIDVTRWRAPKFAGHAFLDGLRAGGELWFPDLRQAMELAGEMAAKVKREEAAVLAATGG